MGSKVNLEEAFLFAFFLVFLFAGPGTVFGHEISHDYPYGYFASDAFQHQVRAESIKEMGNFRYEATYISKGFENAVGRYPPVIYHLAVLLSYASGMETYDSIFFMVMFFSIMGGMVMYFIIRDFNRQVSLLSLPVMLLIFSYPIVIGFTWGHWPSLLAQSFLFFFFWSILHMALKHSYRLIGISFAAVVLIHTSEAVFGVLFLALYLAIMMMTRKMHLREVKTLLFSSAIVFVLTIYYIIIFLHTWARSQPYEFVVEPLWNGGPGFYITGFGLLVIPLVAGLLLSFPLLKKNHVALVVSLSMLISGFLNYVGFGLRSFQIRFFWPIYLSVLIGLGLYFPCKSLIKNLSTAKSCGISLVMIILLLGVVNVPAYKQTSSHVIPYIPQLSFQSSPGIMDPYHWEALQWLSKNTGKQEDIYFFYGDIYNQDALLRNAERFHQMVTLQGIAEAIQGGKLQRYYTSKLPGDSGGGIMVRKGLFDFENAVKTAPEGYFDTRQDICSFDYVVFDKVSREKSLADYGLLVASEMLKNDFVKKVFENGMVVILKNNRKGVQCIEERSLR